MKPEDWIIVGVAFSTFAVFILAEWLVWRWRGVRKYEAKDSLANYALVTMQFWLGVAGKALFIVTALDWIQQRGLRLVSSAQPSRAVFVGDSRIASFVGVDEFFGRLAATSAGTLGRLAVFHGAGVGWIFGACDFDDVRVQSVLSIFHSYGIDR